MNGASAKQLRAQKGTKQRVREIYIKTSEMLCYCFWVENFFLSAVFDILLCFLLCWIFIQHSTHKVYGEVLSSADNPGERFGVYATITLTLRVLRICKWKTYKFIWDLITCWANIGFILSNLLAFCWILRESSPNVDACECCIFEFEIQFSYRTSSSSSRNGSKLVAHNMQDVLHCISNLRDWNWIDSRSISNQFDGKFFLYVFRTRIFLSFMFQIVRLKLWIIWKFMWWNAASFLIRELSLALPAHPCKISFDWNSIWFCFFFFYFPFVVAQKKSFSFPTRRVPFTAPA